jgi:hypothetical protein
VDHGLPEALRGADVKREVVDRHTLYSGLRRQQKGVEEQRECEQD